MAYPILSSLLDESALKHFLTTWPDQPVFTHGPRSRLPDIFQTSALKSIDKLSNAYHGCTMESDLRADGKMKTVTDKVNTILARGHTAHLGDVSPLINGMDNFLQQLAGELGIDTDSIRAAAFVSETGNGASCHYDVLEVISIQLIGTKHFYIAPVHEIRYPYGYQYCPESPPYDSLYPQISRSFPDYTTQDFKQIDMQPGSVLCMPRGTWHHTEANSTSMSISLVLSPPNEIENLVDQLTVTLLQNAEWRRPRYGLKGKKTNGKSISVRLETPEHTAEIIKWIVLQEGPFTVHQLMKQFSGLNAEIVEQVFKIASEAELVRFLWFDPVAH
ncbi:hypothetical protein MNBD_GAMMA15-2615 [hydrothermal vent metagenome]|uniref:JmjC domain-containing protein n=1 Tax=hydrothermal vent metagenome TaxID=652676 RepID=A0A3B0YMM9_9ZZZZ